VIALAPLAEFDSSEKEKDHKATGTISCSCKRTIQKRGIKDRRSTDVGERHSFILSLKLGGKKMQEEIQLWGKGASCKLAGKSPRILTNERKIT